MKIGLHLSWEMEVEMLLKNYVFEVVVPEVGQMQTFVSADEVRHLLWEAFEDYGLIGVSIDYRGSKEQN
jgi:hypothetical protein